MVKTLCFQHRECGLDSWSWESRSHMLNGAAKNKNKVVSISRFFLFMSFISRSILFTIKSKDTNSQGQVKNIL